MSQRRIIPAPPEYKAGEEAAISELLRCCFGDTLPGHARVSIMRVEAPAEVPNTIHATVSVDGQEVGATVGTWLQHPGEKRPHACVFTVFPKFVQ